VGAGIEGGAGSRIGGGAGSVASAGASSVMASGGGGAPLALLAYGADARLWQFFPKLSQLLGDRRHGVGPGVLSFDADEVEGALAEQLDRGLEIEGARLVGDAGVGGPVGAGRRDVEANFVCSPFSAKVRLALIQSYLNTKTQNKCSIGSVIKNWESFGTNFYGNGGWDGWFNLTQNSSNNPLGAYLEEKDSLNSSMNSKLQHYQNQLTQGNGFLSWETCADSGSSGQTTNGSVRTVCTVQSATGSVNGQTIQCSAPNYCPVDDRCVQSIIQTYKNGQWVTGSGDTGSATVDTGVSSQIANCPSGKTQVNTPGSVIEKQLANTLGEPLAELGVAQSINQIVGALLVQMVKSVVGGSGSGGLSGLSQSSSGSSSLQSQLDPNSSAGTAQFNTEQNQITKTESTLLNQSSGGSNTTTTQQTKPTITLIGIDGSSATGSDPNNPMNWKQGQIWQEPGAVSSDPTDGDLTAKIVISGNVDVNTPGTYTLTYTVTNSQGVSSDPVTRTVQVISAVSTGQ
jgi:hypothetical protein